MLALQKTRPAFGVSLEEVAEPTFPAGSDLVVEVAAAGICGTDVHIYEWTGGYEFMAQSLPITLGHEFCGRVRAVGPEAHGFAVGDRVTVMPYGWCGACPACARDDAHLCPRPAPGIGMGRDGGFARLVSVPAARCMPLAGSVPDEIGALTEPLTIGARAVEVSGAGQGDRVLILGPGPIGQAIAMTAMLAGVAAADVVIAGKGDAQRLAVVRHLGFEHAVDIGSDRLDDAIRASVGDAPFDVIFEATGAPPVVAQALRLLRRGGVLTAVGIMPAPVALDLTTMVRMQQQIRGSHRGPKRIWRHVLDALAERPSAFAPMITLRLPVARGIEGMELARQRVASKIMLMPGA